LTLENYFRFRANRKY